MTFATATSFTVEEKAATETPAPAIEFADVSEAANWLLDSLETLLSGPPAHPPCPDPWPLFWVLPELATGKYEPNATTWVKIKNRSYSRAEGRAEFFAERLTSSRFRSGAAMKINAAPLTLEWNSRPHRNYVKINRTAYPND